MEKLNMANMNTLFKKVYLLAGVIMAANMFVVNEMSAMEEKYEIQSTGEKNKNSSISNILDTASGFILLWENTINLAGGVFFSVANNYLKWWDYNPGSYWKLGCLGWRSGRHIKDIFQFGINLNLGRGILWLISGTYNFIKFFTVDEKEKEDYVKPLYFSCLVTDRVYKFFDDSDLAANIALIGFFLLQGFVSVPLAIHISNFSIAISLDSILWASVGKFLSLVDGTKKEENKNEREFYINLSNY